MSPIVRHGYANPATKKSRDTQQWRRFRAWRLANYPDCELRYQGCTGRATTVHLDASLNGNHALATFEHTLSCCRHCHGLRGGL